MALEASEKADEATKAAEALVANLRKENEEIFEELKLFKDDLLSLQPLEAMPDNQIATHFTDLFKVVARWIEEEFCEGPSSKLVN